MAKKTKKKPQSAGSLTTALLFILIGVLFCIYDPGQFDVLQGTNFFRSFTWLHLLWGIWVIDMAAQLFPLKAHISLGSQKLWKMRFEPIRQELQEKVTVDALKKYIMNTTRAAYKVFLIWTILIASLGFLKLFGVLPHSDAVYRCDCDGEPSAKLPDNDPMKTALKGIMQSIGL